jgi:flagellar motor switch protein FliM
MTMTSPASPAALRATIVERLVGDTGEPDRVIAAARALAERAIAGALSSLNASLASPVELEIASVELARFAAGKPKGGSNHTMTIAPSASSPDALMLVADPDAVAVLVAALFAGDPDLPVTPIRRPLSPTETAVAGLAFRALAEAVNGSGERSFEIRFPLPAAITGEAIAKQVVRDGPAVSVAFRLFSGSGSGTITMFMPQRVLLKHRGDTVPEPAQDKAAQRNWGERLSEEVMRSTVQVTATMPLARLTLGEVAGLKIGQVLALGSDAQRGVHLRARKQTLFVCEFGKLGQNYTVRIRHPFNAAQDLMDGLLSA